MVIHSGVRPAGIGPVRTDQEIGFRDGLSYVWQVYLPKLPFMDEQFKYGIYPLWDYYFQGFVGRFGYFNFGFQDRVNYIGLAVAAVVVGLAARALWLRRERVRERLPELACYGVMALGLLVLLGVAGYQFESRTGLPFEQTRYLFPLLPLYAAALALAARGAGRLARHAGVAIVGIAAAHELFALLLTVAHYYS